MLKKALTLLLALSMVLALSVTVLAANNVEIKQLVGPGEYKTAYVIPNVSDKKTYAVSADDLGSAGSNLYYPSVDSLTGYTIAAGTKIDVSGKVYSIWLMEEKGGKLMLVKDRKIDYSKLLTLTGKLEQDEVWEAMSKGSTVQFNGAGYYLFTAQQPSPRQDPSTAVILKVGNPGSGSATTAAQKPSASSTPASEKTVKIAGQDRTPGQIQTYSSGGYIYTVNYGDTLYDIAKRFYGDGSLWKELQKANQEWLDETKDGTIFVGFNLLIPVELDDVRADVG